MTAEQKKEIIEELREQCKCGMPPYEEAEVIMEALDALERQLNYCPNCSAKMKGVINAESI